MKCTQNRKSPMHAKIATGSLIKTHPSSFSKTGFKTDKDCSKEHTCYLLKQVTHKECDEQTEGQIAKNNHYLQASSKIIQVTGKLTCIVWSAQFQFSPDKKAHGMFNSLENLFSGTNKLDKVP